MTDELKKLKEDHEISFINSYKEWNNMLIDLNNSIIKILNINGLSTSKYKDHLYNYNEFCQNYISRVIKIYESNNSFIENDINIIINDMILLKVNEIKLLYKDIININYFKEFNKMQAFGRDV